MSPPVGCYHLQPTSPFIIITQPKGRHSFYRPTEGRRLSWLRYCFYLYNCNKYATNAKPFMVCWHKIFTTDSWTFINFPRDNSRHIRTDDVEMSLTCQAGSRHCSADSRRQTDRHERPWKNSSITINNKNSLTSSNAYCARTSSINNFQLNSSYTLNCWDIYCKNSKQNRCTYGRMAGCRTCDREVVGSNPARGCSVPTPT